MSVVIIIHLSWVFSLVVFIKKFNFVAETFLIQFLKLFSIRIFIYSSKIKHLSGSDVSAAHSTLSIPKVQSK